MTGYTQEVLNRVQGGTANIDLLISPPRTGSTIMGKVLAYEGGYDGYINEPGARFTSEGDERIQDTYRIIHDRITEIEQNLSPRDRDLESQPIQILIKDIAQHYGPERELENLMDITQGKVAVLVRTPVVALESMTLMMCDLVEIMKGEKQHVLDYVAPGADLSHIDFAPGASSTWQQHVNYMRAQRDYSSLGAGFKEWWLECNPMFNTPSLRHDTWENLRNSMSEEAQASLSAHHGFSGWQEFASRYALSPLNELPAVLASPFEFRHGGWDIMKAHTQKMDQLDVPYNVYDFTDCQCFPDSALSSILAGFGKVACRTEGNEEVDLERGYADQEAAYSGIGNVLFGNAESSMEIKPRSTRPIISPNKMPEFLQPYIRDAVSFYAEISQSDMHVRLGSDYPSHLQETDPIFTAVNQMGDRDALVRTTRRAAASRPELSDLMRVISSQAVALGSVHKMAKTTRDSADERATD